MGSYVDRGRILGYIAKMAQDCYGTTEEKRLREIERYVATLPMLRITAVTREETMAEWDKLHPEKEGK